MGTKIRINSKEVKNAIANASIITKQDSSDMGSGWSAIVTREDLQNFMKSMRGMLAAIKYDERIAIYGGNVTYSIYGKVAS